MNARFLALLGVILSTPALADDPLPPVSQKAREVHASAIVIDGHNDLPWRLRKDGDVTFTTLDIGKRLTTAQTDIPRLREGGVTAQFWSVYVPSEQKDPARTVTEQIDLVHRMIERYPEHFRLALTAYDIELIARSGRIACLIGIEGGVAIENDLAQLRAFAKLGARYMTLTHNTTLDWADAATDAPKHDGLTPFGERVVKEMNRLGMLVDLSHVSPATMDDALRVSQAPVIFSHSSALAKCPHPRNVPDDILKQVAKNGGVVMVNFYSGFIVKEAAEKVMAARKELKEKHPKPEEFSKALEAWHKTYKMPRGTVADVADHIDHIKKIAGIDHIGLGGDFDGVTSVPVGLEDVSSYPRLTEELMRRGYSTEDVHKILGRNLLRAFLKAGEVADELRKTTKPEVDQPRPEPEARVSPIDPGALQALREKAGRTKSDALLVIHDGEVVVEEDFGKPKGPIYLASAGKSLTALAIGKLIDQGKIRSLDQPVCELFPEWRQGRKHLVTVRHLLNHTSGLQNEPNASMELEPPPFHRVPSLVKLALAAELTNAPGETFAYNNKAYALLAGVIERASGKGMDVFFGEEFFEPMGIKDFGWIRDGGGTPSGHGAFLLTAADLSKFGTLMLDGGMYRGKPIVSRAWVEQSTRPGQPFQPDNGLGWWLTGIEQVRTVDAEILRGMKVAGVSANFIEAMSRLQGREFHHVDEVSGALREVLGESWQARIGEARRGKMFKLFNSSYSGGVDGFSAQGYRGEYLVVIPGKKLVAVRLKRADEEADEVNAFGEFPNYVRALVR